VGIVGLPTRGGVNLTGFTGAGLGASSMTTGASFSGRGAITWGERGSSLGSEESAGMRVRFDLEAMDNDKPDLFPSAFLNPLRPIAHLLDRAVAPALLEMGHSELIYSLDRGNGSRTTLLASLCSVNGLGDGGKSIGCVVVEPLSLLPLPVAIRGCFVHIHDVPMSICPISDRLLPRDDQNINTVGPNGSVGCTALLPIP
jgi:hypothetical protein